MLIQFISFVFVKYSPTWAHNPWVQGVPNEYRLNIKMNTNKTLEE